MIAAYRGVSLVSRAIRWFSREVYSHISWIEFDGSEFEAWVQGVTYTPTFGAAHTPGTEIDLFHVGLAGHEHVALLTFLRQQIGKRYDWRGVAKFLTRRPESPVDQDRWFCSELVFASLLAAGAPPLLRVEPWKVSPAMLVYSPMLWHVGTVHAGDPIETLKTLPHKELP
jgi:hypothetical protein